MPNLFEPEAAAPDCRRVVMTELRALADVFRQAAATSTKLPTIATFSSCAETAERRVDQLQQGAPLLP